MRLMGLIINYFIWRDNYFKIEKLENFNYVNIFKNKNGKICGKDNYGNNLYFPNDVECPINDIIIDNSNKNYIDYKEIKLTNNTSLYYTNKKISNKIIIELKANPSNYQINLNLAHSNGICSYLEGYFDKLKDQCRKDKYYGINSYIIIDNWNYNSFLLDTLPSTRIIEGELSLLGITYFGFDPSTIKERKQIQAIKWIFLAFLIFQILMDILSILNGILRSYTLCLFSFYNFLLILLILILFQIIIYLIALIMRINNIHNFIFKIIYKYEENENEYKCIICFYIIILIANFSLLFKSIHFYYYTFIDIKKDKNLTSNENGNNKNKEKNEKIENLQKNLDTERLKINKKNPLESNKNKNENKINKSKEEGNNPNILIQIKKKEKGSDNNTELSNINNKKEDNDKKVEKSKFQISESNIKHKCAICLEDPNQVIIAPCGHRCLCFDCYKKQKDFLKKCPICQKNIISFIEKIYDL